MVDHAIRPGNSGLQSSPNFAPITPSDGVNLPYITRGIYIGAAGNIAVICPATGAAIVFVGLPAGVLLPIQTTRVNLTNTTAANLIALF